MGEKFGAGGWKGSYKKTRERGRERERTNLEANQRF